MKSSINVISQKNMDKVFHSKNIIMLKKKLLINYFNLKDKWNCVRGICIKIHFICLSKH
jgi:hypothetical protein